MIPPGFDLLYSMGVDDPDDDAEESNAYYRIERDGSASIIANRSKRILSVGLQDGSRISGGINQQGMLFGDRIVPMPEGTLRRYPLRWYEPVDSPSTVESTMLPAASKPGSSPPASKPRKGADPDTLAALREAADAVEDYATRQAKLEAENVELRARIDALTARVSGIETSK